MPNDILPVRPRCGGEKQTLIDPTFQASLHHTDVNPGGIAYHFSTQDLHKRIHSQYLQEITIWRFADVHARCLGSTAVDTPIERRRLGSDGLGGDIGGDKRTGR